MSQSSQKNDIITIVETYDPYNQVIEAHKRLNQEVENLGNKIDEKIQKSEGQFLVAYQNHLRKIRIELSQLRSKFQQHQKQNSKNDRVFLLEKQNILFRDEALKLYNRLQQKTQQAQIYKQKSKQLQSSLQIVHRQLKQQLKDRKVLQNKVTSLQLKISSLQQQLSTKTQKKYISSRQLVSIITNSQQKPKHSALKNNTSGFRCRDRQFGQMSQTKTTKHQIKSQKQKKSMIYTTGNFINKNHDQQLKTWFLQCIKTIKKDVALRKNSIDQVNLDYIVNIDKFKMVDKLRLLEKFMENQKLLTWMYQKIFPSRLNQLTQYLSKGKTELIVKNSNQTLQKNSNQAFQKSPNQSFHKNPNQTLHKNPNQTLHKNDNDNLKSSENNFEFKEMQEIQPNFTQSVEMTNNRFLQLKNKKNVIRNKVMIKNGKLNLTSV